MNVPISTAPNSLSRGGSTRGTIGAVAEPLVAIVLSRRQEVKSGGREVLARKYARTGIISRGSSRHDQHNYRFFLAGFSVRILSIGKEESFPRRISGSKTVVDQLTKTSEPSSHRHHASSKVDALACLPHRAGE